MLGCAWFDSGTCSASAPWCFFGRIFYVKVVLGSWSRLCPALLFVAALVVDLGRGMCLLVLLVTVHLALCSLRLPQVWERRSRTADASVTKFA